MVFMANREGLRSGRPRVDPIGVCSQFKKVRRVKRRGSKAHDRFWLWLLPSDLTRFQPTVASVPAASHADRVFSEKRNCIRLLGAFIVRSDCYSARVAGAGQFEWNMVGQTFLSASIRGNP